MVRRLPEDRRRADILDAAKACFVRDGFAATRMDDVAKGAQLSKGGLYFHFKSKQELMIAVVERENQILDEFLHQVDRWGEDFSVQLDRMIEFYFGYLTANVGSAKLSQCALDEAERNDQIAHVLSMGEQRFIDFLEGQIEAANARNEISLQSDPRTAARFLMVIIEGIKTKYLQFPDWPWAEVLETARRGFFDGIFTAKGSA